MRAAKKWRQYRDGILFLAPFAVLFTVFVIVPVVVSFFNSFTNDNMLQQSSFVGLANYVQLMTNDDIFLKALANTFIFACITGPAGFALSFLAAWIIDMLRFKRGFALLFYVPSITSGVAMSSIWLYFFSSDRFGLINHIFSRIGLIPSPIQWTLDPQLILPMVMFVQFWMSMGTGFLVFMAGLQSINREYYEAAAIDGLQGRFQQLLYITLPAMKPQLLFGAVNAVVNSFSVFDIAVGLAGMPSPNYAAHTIVAHLYDHAFIRFEMGYASAIAMVLFVITFGIGQVLFKVLGEKQ